MLCHDISDISKNSEMWNCKHGVLLQIVKLKRKNHVFLIELLKQCINGEVP